MWKRDEAVRPASGQPAAAPQPPAPAQAGAPGPRSELSHSMEKDIVNIGKSVDRERGAELPVYPGPRVVQISGSEIVSQRLHAESRAHGHVEIRRGVLPRRQRQRSVEKDGRHRGAVE